jgi:hypothetical protein
MAAAAPAMADTPARPVIQFNRWQEDWSVLVDPSVPHEVLDGLKYIPLSTSDTKTYLSFGAGLRERFETNDVGFGVPPSKSQSYVISRAELHADLRIVDQLQAFVQLQSINTPGKIDVTPVDNDRLDLEQGFIALTEPLGSGTLKLRAGRQQFAFDLQRFVSVRDGPGARQSYDALWADYETGPWRIIGFYSHPVQVRDRRAFDDSSSGRFVYGGLRAEHDMGGLGNVAVYLSQFRQDGSRYPTIAGNERRNVADVRWAGTNGAWDWDIEAMGQWGRIAPQNIAAWAMGSRGGYTFADLPWRPRLGLQIDAASGDADPHDRTLNTFNPLFPNGYYVTLSGLTGYTNFIHLKSRVTVTPFSALTAFVAVAALWRETTADAVYTQPNVPVPGTVGNRNAFTGAYVQLRGDWHIDAHLTAAFEAVHFAVGQPIEAAGGHDPNYLSLEIKYGW